VLVGGQGVRDRRDRLHPCQHVRTRGPLGQQLLDLGFGPVRGGRQQLVGCLLTEMGRQQDDGTQMQAA